MAKKYIVVEVDTVTGIVGTWDVHAKKGKRFLSDKSSFDLCEGDGECIRIPDYLNAGNFGSFEVSEALVLYANYENMVRKESDKWEVCE